ncbi:calaxin [Leptopilina boulardi]|uniref:calaxin n=1 Tax=Leptopilina boulardi TaxID=63433 RepID=UPI0021F64E37|nr:calaxin [Leptopilina boulardi]
MSKEQSAKPTSASRSGGECLNGDGAAGRLPISGSAGAMVMKSVSLFLARGRKTSVSSRRQQSTSVDQKQELVNKRKRRTRIDPKMKSAAYYARIIELLKKKTKFSKVELESLCKIYGTLTHIPKQPGEVTGHSSSSQITEGIDRTIFRELLHNTFNIITEDTLIERMFVCWDKESEGVIKLQPWILGLDLLLRGTQREKMAFCFKVYDLNSDGYITKDEIFQLFKNCLIKQPGEEDPDEGVRDLSELALKKLDVDHDGKISFEDYEATVNEEPLLLEAFGQCLPTSESIVAFLITLRP